MAEHTSRGDTRDGMLTAAAAEYYSYAYTFTRHCSDATWDCDNFVHVGTLLLLRLHPPAEKFLHRIEHGLSFMTHLVDSIGERHLHAVAVSKRTY